MIRVLRETHETPLWADRILRLAGGINRFGENNFRVSWGWNRLTWIGGRWEDRDARHGGLIREVLELRKVPKYTPFDRWHIERWMPPEAYGSPAEWYARTLEIEGGQAIAALGPYPERGEYEHCFTLAGPRGEFVQLTPTVAEYVARAIEFSRGLPASRRRKALDSREANREREYDRWAYDVLDDAVPALHGLPFVTVGS
jgi:hypothetical protein